ncbi:MAG: TrmH family RNA methyltransferase [Candidatus Nanopelagicales bacterium]
MRLPSQRSSRSQSRLCRQPQPESIYPVSHSSPELTSPRSPRVAAVKRLHGSRGRRDSRLFVTEGPQGVREALQCQGVVQEIFLSATGTSACRELAARADVPVTVVAEEVLAAMGETQAPQGILAVCHWITRPLDEVVRPGVSMLVIIDGAGDPGNVGTIIRTAHAAGADGVVLTHESVDPHNGKCVRATAGSLFHLPIATGADAEQISTLAQAADLVLAVTAADGDTGLYELVSRPDRPAIGWILGSEAHGVSDEMRGVADISVAIPMFGAAESLNVGSAAAICLYSDAAARHGLTAPPIAPA